MKARELAELLMRFPDADVFDDQDGAALCVIDAIRVGASKKNVVVWSSHSCMDPAVYADIKAGERIEGRDA